MTSIDPAWIMLGLTILNMVFMAGVFFGGLLPLRGQVKGLETKIESAATAREAQAATNAELKTIVNGLKEDVMLLRKGA